MSVAETMRDSKWSIAECHVIAQAAYHDFIEIEPWEIAPYLFEWRQWFYGLLPDSAALELPGARSVPVSER